MRYIWAVFFADLCSHAQDNEIPLVLVNARTGQNVSWTVSARELREMDPSELSRRYGSAAFATLQQITDEVPQ